jgi:death-on-curing protein
LSWIWIRADVLDALHDRQLAEHGGAEGVLDAGRIEEALARPQNLAAYATPDAAELAASYAHGLALNHGFADGNKRAAWVCARLFLQLNGCKLQYDPAEAIFKMEMLAAGKLSEVEMAAWIRECLIQSI